MRPTFLGFETAYSAIYTSQKALDIVGSNLANTNTVGYTRQRVDVSSVVVQNQNNKVATNPVGLMGQGIEILGIDQVRDKFLDTRFREEYGNAAYHGKSAEILDSIQVALGDGADITDEGGLYNSIAELYANLNSFIQEPTMDAQANLVMSSFTNISQILNQLDSNLTNAAAEHAEDLKVEVERINEIAQRISHLNEIISEDSLILLSPDNNNYGPNELYDERNLLLDELSSYGNITVTELSNGMIDVMFGEDELVTGLEHDALEMRINEDETVTVSWRSSAEHITTVSGSLLASVHMLNGRGANAQVNNDEPHRGVPYYRDQLDTFASTLAGLANNLLPELDTATGEPLLDADGNTIYKTLLGAKLPNGQTVDIGITAANISVSKEWTDNGPGYFIFNPDENVEDYAQELAAKLTDTEYTFTSFGESYTGSFADYLVNMYGKLGSDVSFHEGRNESYATVANNFLDQKNAVSGVSSDEETANMLIYQKSYDAAARLMTTLDEMLDKIINGMGLVGR